MKVQSRERLKPTVKHSKAQRGGCLIHGGTQGQVGWSSEHLIQLQGPLKVLSSSNNGMILGRHTLFLGFVFREGDEMFQINLKDLSRDLDIYLGMSG